MPNLVGIGNSQVPTNAMLGGLAYQDPAHANLTSVEIENIAAIKAKTIDTAVDVFVYDTRKDSDGGAWRHRTQNTSWYTETVGAYRGPRKEFPAVAVIVVTSSALTIYDADDPNCSMWMIFVNDNVKWLKHTTSGPKSVVALNGIVVSCGAGGAGRLSVVNFVSDDGYVTEAGYTYRHDWISTRNSTGVGPTDGGSRSIVNNSCHAVAISVLPNAPIDDATGLPIPTIVVGTEGGVSVLKDNGKVFDLSGFSPVTFVDIEGEKLVAALGGTSTHDFIFKTNLPNKDEQFDAQITAGSGNFYMNSSSSTTPLLRDLNMTAMSYNPLDGTVYRGGDNGFDIIAKTRTVSGSSNISLISYVDTDYNTGYMVGDVKIASLSETDTTAFTGNLVTNGTFGSNVTGWSSSGTATLSHNSGVARLTGDSGAGSWTGGTIMQDLGTNFVVGKTYSVSYQVRSGGNTGNYTQGIGARIQKNAHFHSSSTEFVKQTTSDPGSSFVTKTFTFTATLTRYGIQLFNFHGVEGNYLEYDNIEVKEAVGDFTHTRYDENRTNAPGFLVYGTIEKHAVATGADLVGYRADSSSEGTNYLRMPLNSSMVDLTSDWSINFWAKNNGNTGTNYSGFEIAPDDISTNSAYGTIPISMYMQSNGIVGLRGATVTAVDAASPITNPLVTSGLWRCFNIVSKSGKLYFYIDGDLNTSTTGSFANPGVAYSLYIFGWSYSTTRYFGRRHIDFSLFRMSNSAPTEEQIKKMYDDEKLLFRENAKCTLYGSSSAVTALGFDDTNNTLHVGTSSGRSDFSGLTRINNTTTAVTTAISASNGLVAEQ